MSNAVSLFRRLSVLYADMQDTYQKAAAEIGLDCHGCEQNCCYSYFQHHTHIEWAYLHKGLRSVGAKQKNIFLKRAETYVQESRKALAAGEKPNLLCPLNNDGLCGLYDYRLMICRLHGVPNILRPPKGEPLTFSGCFKSQKLAETQKLPFLDRTPLYIRLAQLEMEFCGHKRLPRVNLTLAEMMLTAPPKPV